MMNTKSKKPPPSQSDPLGSSSRPPKPPTPTAPSQLTAQAPPPVALESGTNANTQKQITAATTSASAAVASAVPARPQRRFPRGLRRLRDRLQTLEDRLRLDVNSLKQDIIDLNVQRLVLNTKHAVQRRLLQQKAVEVVGEYYGAFQHGWIAEDADATNEQLGSITELNMARSPRQPSERAAFLRQRQQLLMDRQRHFVTTALDPAMTMGSTKTNGIDRFVLEWKTYSELHRLARLTLTCMTCHGSADEPIIIAIGTFSGTLTHAALEQMYPHALSDPRFVKKLVGTAIQYPSREVFYFSRAGLITRYDRGLDYVRAFASVLDSLSDVAVVLEGAELWDVGASIHDDDDATEDATVVDKAIGGLVAAAYEVSFGAPTTA